MTTTTFPLTTLQRLRKKAARLGQPPEDGPLRWSKSVVDPMKVLAVFESVWIKDGYILRAYQFREDGRGKGVVWAMPADAAFPEPYDCQRQRNRYRLPPRPPAALDDEMEAIDGDGSPWSYLCASLLGRELFVFGTLRHGCSWHTHTILGQNPLKAKGRKRESTDLPSSDPTAWIWHEAEPAEWQPQVWEDGDKVVVTFYSYSGLGRETIHRHRDTFRQGRYCFRTRRRYVASGPGGYEL